MDFFFKIYVSIWCNRRVKGDQLTEEFVNDPDSGVCPFKSVCCVFSGGGFSVGCARPGRITAWWWWTQEYTPSAGRTHWVCSSVQKFTSPANIWFILMYLSSWWLWDDDFLSGICCDRQKNTLFSTRLFWFL